MKAVGQRRASDRSVARIDGLKTQGLTVGGLGLEFGLKIGVVRGTSLGDLMAQESTPGPDFTVLDVEARERLNSLVAHLDDRAADIIRSRYGLVDGRQHKLADIGTKHGISAERVRQLEREALQKLRRLGDPDLAA